MYKFFGTVPVFRTIATGRGKYRQIYEGLGLATGTLKCQKANTSNKVIT